MTNSRTGGSREGLFHIFSSALSAILRSEPQRAGFSAGGSGEIKLTTHLDRAKSFYSIAHLAIFFQHTGAQLIRFLTEDLQYVFSHLYMSNVTFFLDK